MDFKDLSILKKVLVILFLIFISPLLIISEILIIIIFPIEYLEYKKSYYHKKYKIKYYTGITRSDSFKVINYFEENNINYQSFNSEEDSIKIGENTYFFPWFEVISFNEFGDCIISEQDNYDFELLNDSPKIKDKKNTKVLVSERYFDKNDIKKVKKENLLFLYEKISDLNNIDWK